MLAKKHTDFLRLSIFDAYSPSSAAACHGKSYKFLHDSAALVYAATARSSFPANRYKSPVYLSSREGVLFLFFSIGISDRAKPVTADPWVTAAGGPGKSVVKAGLGGIENEDWLLPCNATRLQ